MAVIYKPGLNEADKEKEAGTPQQITQAGGGTITAAPSVSTPAGASGPTKSGSFSNLRGYLEANKPAIEKQAGQIVSDIEQQARGLAGRTEQAVQDIKTIGEQQVQTAQTGTGLVIPPPVIPQTTPVQAEQQMTTSPTIQQEQPKRSAPVAAPVEKPKTGLAKAVSDFGKAVTQTEPSKLEQKITQAVQTAPVPTPTLGAGEISTLTPEQQAAITATLAATSTVPTQLQDQQLASDIAKFTGLTGSVGTEDERREFLRQYSGSPTYTTGMATLGNLFLQADPTSAAALSRVSDIGQQISEQYQRAVEDVPTLASGYANLLQQERERTLQGLQDYASQIGALPTQRMEQAIDRFSKGIITEEDMLKFGIDEYTANLLRNDPNLRQQVINSGFFSPEQFVTQADISNFAALQNIVGEYGSDELNALLAAAPTQIGGILGAAGGFDPGIVQALLSDVATGTPISGVGFGGPSFREPLPIQADHSGQYVPPQEQIVNTGYIGGA